MTVEDEDSLVREALEIAASSRPPRWLPEQMTKCSACNRANAPTRATCIYCGAILAVTAEAIALRQLVWRELEEGESGFNVVVTTHELGARADDELKTQTAELLHLSAAQWQAILDASSAAQALPAARLASSMEADLLAAQLGRLGLGVEIIPDDMLTLESLPPKRIRSFEFTERSLTGWTFGAAEELRCLWSEIALIVAGRVFVRRVEVEERRARGPEKELLDAREIDSDEVLIDIYSDAADGGWRIAAHSFDFSCLGQSKGLVAAENINKLISVIRERAASAAFDDNYRRLRATLDPVWPIERRSESRGLRRARGGGFSSEAAVISTNLNQFTAYSRLRHYFVSRARA